MIPDFIYQELIGPYGADTLKKLGQIERYYSIYDHGTRFEVDKSGDYIPAVLPSKQIKKLIRREAQFLFGKTPEFRVSCPEESKTENGKPNETAMQSFLNTVLTRNRWPDKLIKGARDCFIGAKVALKLNIADDRIGVVFAPADGFVYETAIDDIDVIQRIVFFFTMQDDKDRARQRIWVQKYRLENNKCLLDEKITDGYGQPVEWEGAKENFDTGLDRIPAYVIVNDGLSGDTDGVSEIEDLMQDDAWYGKMKSGNLDSLRKGMNQITWMTGVEPECMKDFQFAPGALWDLKADPAQASGDSNAANVKVDTISNDFAYAQAFDDTISNIKQDMHDLAGVPDLNLDSTKSIITSGKGLKTLYWPLVCRCEEKMNAWRPAFIWLAETIFHAAEVFPGLKKVYGDFALSPFEISVENQYPLPEDEDQERTLDLSEVGNKARSIKSYLMKWGGPDRKGLAEDDANAELQQIALERQLLEDDFINELPPGND